MKQTLIFGIFILVVLAFLFSISGKKYPQMPSDPAHMNLTETGTCLDCHGQGKIYPQKKEHPPKSECLTCHKHKRLKKV